MSLENLTVEQTVEGAVEMVAFCVHQSRILSKMAINNARTAIDFVSR